MASVESNKMLAVAAAACDDKKAEDIRILALDPAESGLSDYFLICTGTNDRQTVAITDEIELRLKREFGTYPNAVEGRRQGEWILMDYVDFIVHVFLPEKRAFYGLERLRASATTLSVADLNAEIKAAIRAERAPKKAKDSSEDEENSGSDAADDSVQATPGKRAAVKGSVMAGSSSARTLASGAKAGKSSPKKAPGKTAGSTATRKKVSAKKVVSSKALDTRGAAKAALKGATKAVSKAAAKKRTRSAE